MDGISQGRARWCSCFRQGSELCLMDLFGIRTDPYLFVSFLRGSVKMKEETSTRIGVVNELSE